MANPRQREAAIQRRVKAILTQYGWHVEVLSCNAFQKGIPDLYCFKRRRLPDWKPDCIRHDADLHRWVDVKRPKGGTLTKAQVQKWSLWETIGLGVWIITGQEINMEETLLGPPNWRDWWQPRYEKYLCKSPADLLREANDDDSDHC